VSGKEISSRPLMSMGDPRSQPNGLAFVDLDGLVLPQELAGDFGNLPVDFFEKFFLSSRFLHHADRMLPCL